MYTEDELAAAVDQFLLQRVEVPRLHGGSRDVEALQQRVFDLVSVALMMRPDSYFYVVWLARNRTLALVRQQLKRLEYIESVGPGVLRPSVPIESTALLVNAEAALLTLNAGLNARSAGVSGDIGPATDRFRRSIETFARAELTKNVVSQGAVVSTAAELRGEVASRWSGAVSTHESIVELSGGLAEAVSRLGAVQLPARTIRDVVGRIRDRLTTLREDLDSTRGVAASRLALLDLLAMRSVLTKATGFRPPALVLAPPRGSSTVATPLDSAGTLAQLVGTVSGPYHVVGASPLELLIDGVVRTPAVLEDSRAELRSAALTLPGGAGLIELAIEVNGSLNTSTFDLSLYVSGVALAAALDAAYADLDVSWDGGTDQLVIQETVPTDPGALQVLLDSPAREGILTELWVGSPTFMAATPVPADTVVAQLNAQLTDATAEVLLTQYYRGEALVSGTTVSQQLGVEATWSEISTRSVELGTNYQSLGARAGYTLIVSDGFVDVYYDIVSVRAGLITVSEDLDLALATELRVGFRFDNVPVGARVFVGADAGVGNGFYRRAVGGSGFEMELETPVLSYVGVADILVSTSFIAITTKSSTTSSGVAVSTIDDGNTALGFAVAEALPSLSEVQVAADLLAQGVRPGDYIDLTNPLGATQRHTLLSVQAHRVSFTPSREYVPGVWNYQVLNARYTAYEPLRVEAESFAAFLPATMRQLDTEVGRLIRGAQYEGSQIQAAVVQYRETLESLEAALVAYSVPRELGIEAILRTLEEQGMSRAQDKLTRLELVEFFSMGPDGTSFSTHMMRTMAKTVRSVAPTHKNSRSQFGTSTGRTTGRAVDPYTAGDANSE